MKAGTLLFPLLSLLAFASLLTACGGAAVTEVPETKVIPQTGATQVPATEAAANMDKLVAAAQKEGTLITIALPHDWCNYGEAIDTFKSKYNIEINELNPDAGFEDEVDAIIANKANKGPQAPDVIDVGLSFGDSSKAASLIQPYKVST
jgi:putative spermidine/putrescine transport system substrate-binding protein